MSKMPISQENIILNIKTKIKEAKSVSAFTDYYNNIVCKRPSYPFANYDDALKCMGELKMKSLNREWVWMLSNIVKLRNQDIRPLKKLEEAGYLKIIGKTVKGITVVKLLDRKQNEKSNNTKEKTSK